MAAEELDLLILKTLALASLHAFGIGQRIEKMSRGVFRVTPGSLYPALQFGQGLTTANYDRTRGGRFVILRRGTQGVSMNLVLNWAEELKKIRAQGGTGRWPSARAASRRAARLPTFDDPHARRAPRTV